MTEIKHIKYRTYQTNCLDDMEAHYNTNDKGIICIPTGGGKTIIFSKFCNNKNALIISHTEELVMQAKNKYEFVNDKPCGIANSNNWEIDHPTISSSIQTLAARVDTPEFKELIKNIDYLIVDEAHHFPADTYLRVYNAIKEENEKLKLLGVTATPFRTDRIELKEYFDEMIYNISIKDLILEDFLVPTKAKILKIPDNLAKFNNVKIIKNKDGITDFSLKSLSKTLGEDNVLEYVTNKFIKEWENRKTLFFTTGIEISKKLVSILVEKGINAVHIDGTLSKKERNNIITKYHNKEIDVLSNVDILTEGYDDPSTECIALLRPTKSLNLYAQIIGRGLRPSIETGKKDCLVLDFTPATEKFNKGLANLFELFDIVADKKSKEGLREFSIGKDKNRNLLVNFGDTENELALFDFKPDVTDYMIEIHDKKILSCGLYSNTIITESNDVNNLFKIEIINTDDGEINTLNSIPENITFNKMFELWEDSTNTIQIKKDSEKITTAGEIYDCIKIIKDINTTVVNNKEWDHKYIIVDDEESLNKMNNIQLKLFKKYITYFRNHILKTTNEKYWIICENMLVNYSSHINFGSIRQLLYFYNEQPEKIRFQNQIMTDLILFVNPIKDKEWIPETLFIKKRTMKGFTFEFILNNQIKKHEVRYDEIQDVKFYKEILLYMLQRLDFIRKNKSENPAYYKVPTIKLLKEIRPVTKKLKFYQEAKYLLKFK